METTQKPKEEKPAEKPVIKKEEKIIYHVSKK